ncbi:MAG TPA: UbiA family prenyltransferase [Thermoanaerobaculia bacterium]|nr:UbiA family prenyltransferase [Thermoanaerobaculia bacterium]
MPAVRDYIELARPFTLVPPLLGIISGAVCAWGSVHNPDPARELTASVVLTVVLGSLCAAFLNAASNTLNQIHDIEIDRVNKPARPLVTGAISSERARRIMWIWYALAIIPTWLVVVHPFDSFREKLFAPLAYHECFFIYVAGMIFTFIYSAPALGRTKRHPLLANLTIAVPRGMLLKVAGWAMVANVVSSEPWYIGLVFMLFLLGAASTKDFSDIDGDRAGGVTTLPIRFGVRTAAFLIAPFFVLPWLLIPIGAHLRDPLAPQHTILTGDPTLLVVLGATLAVWGSWTAWLLVRRPEELTATENHPSWRHMYLMMMFAQIGFALAYVL